MNGWDYFLLSDQLNTPYRIGKKIISIYLGRISDYKNEQDALEKAKSLFQKRIAESQINDVFGDKSKLEDQD